MWANSKESCGPNLAQKPLYLVGTVLKDPLWMNKNIYLVFTNNKHPKKRTLHPCSCLLESTEFSLGDICSALSTSRLQLKLELLRLQIMGFSVPQNSRHFMMFTWSNQLTLNPVKAVLQVHKTTHKTQRARYRRYNVTAPLIIFNNFSFKSE